MGLVIYPEIKIARKILAYHGLTIPFDLSALVSEYAELHYKEIPIYGVDGICMNLKNPRKKTKVILNTYTSINRQRFTLAHELGHIIIPWHLGTIVDDLNSARTNSKYWTLESEANRFASELLMPFEWIYTLVENTDFDYNFILGKIRSECQVSEEAAKIRLNRFWYELIDHELPRETITSLRSTYSDISYIHKLLTEGSRFYPEIVAQQLVEHLDTRIAFVVEKDGIVIDGGTSPCTRANIQHQGQIFNPNPYPFYNDYSIYRNEYSNTHWWDLNIDLGQQDDDRPWRDVLSNIVSQVYPLDQAKSIKASINGTISGTHGSFKRKSNEKNLEEFIADITSSFNIDQYKAFIKHPDFRIFVRKRCAELFKGKDA